MSGPPDIRPEDLLDEPLARARTIPSAWYTDPQFHAFDRRAVFERTWQYVGAASMLDRSGAYVSDTLGGNPVIVVRDGDAVRAFFNVCRHRGGPLAMEACGHARMLQCKYHGWTYRLDGSLRGVPRFDRTELFDRKEHGLIPLETAEWGGMLFVGLQKRGMRPLGSVVAGILERIEPIRLDRLRYTARRSYDVECDWKVYVDNYLEGYHIPLVHPDLCDVIDFGNYETEVFEHYSLQTSPIDAADSPYGAAGTAGEDRAWYFFVYPNLMLNIVPGRLQVNRVDAIGPGRCRVHFDYYYSDDDDDTRQRRLTEDHAFSDLVQKEDIEICEHVQCGLASRGYDRGRFSVDLEGGVHHFQSLLRASYRGAMNEVGE